MPTDGEHLELWVMEPAACALVMGSSQKAELFDAELLASDDVELAGRRSGGGAVYIDPAEMVWVDVLAPRTSDVWSDDLGETFLQVGRRWQRALGSFGVTAALCERPPVREPASTLACWAGIGWGELTIGQAKVVGLSQRRTRWGARIQAMAVLGTSAAAVARYLPAEHRSMVDEAIPTVDADLLAEAGVTAQTLLAAVIREFAPAS